MDFTGTGGEGDSLVDSRREDLEELITLLDNYKLEIGNKCEENSVAPIGLAVASEDDVARAMLVKKMVLIKRKSFAQFSVNGCRNNRLNDEYDSDASSDEDGSGEREGLVSACTSAGASEEAGNSACSSIGGIKVSELDELISLLNESLLEDDSKDEADVTQARRCSKLSRRLTVVEELLMEKRNSSHCLVPRSCSGDVCNPDFIRDKFGICRKIIAVARINRSPKPQKTLAGKKELT